MNANEQFIVKHYSEDERPTLKGHGFDGLVIGDDRQEAQDFVDYLNTMLRQQQAEILAGKIMIKGYSKTIDEQQSEIERLTKENRDLGYYIDGWHKWKLQLQEFIK